MARIEVEIPINTLKEADRGIEKALKVTLDHVSDIQFTFNCGHCDQTHHAGLPPIITAALLRANVELICDSLLAHTQAADHDEAAQALQLYTGIFRNLYRDNTANASILADELKALPLEVPGVPTTLLTIPLEGWSGER